MAVVGYFSGVILPPGGKIATSLIKLSGGRNGEIIFKVEVRGPSIKNYDFTQRADEIAILL